MRKKKKYSISVTFPLTMWVEVRALSPEEAIEKARNKAIKAPIEDWGDDFSQSEFDIVEVED